MDSLCHMMHDGRMYNGFVRDDDVTADGCARLAIINYKQGIVTRGVLMDIARLKGVDYLEPGTPIYVEDLEAWEREAGVRVEPGDIVLVRAGRWARRAETGAWNTGQQAAGLHASVAPWLHERGVAMLGADYTNDALPSGVEGVTQPIHQLTIVAMGMPLFDIGTKCATHLATLGLELGYVASGNSKLHQASDWSHDKRWRKSLITSCHACDSWKQRPPSC